MVERPKAVRLPGRGTPVFMGPTGEWGLAADMRVGRPMAEVAEGFFGGAPAAGGGVQGETLVDAQDCVQADRLGDLANTLDYEGNAAFEACQTPNMIVAMPVAAHQEQRTVGRALEQYLGQQNAPPYQVALYANWPASADRTAVTDTLSSIRQFMNDHPELPLGMFSGETRDGIKIGGIRQLLWCAALYKPAFMNRTDDIVMVNHDADITYLSPHYLRDMYQVFKPSPDRPLTTMAYPRGAHQRNAHLPNMDSVAAWYELSTRLIHSYFEMGVSISARAFMAAGGFRQSRQEGEMLRLVQDIHEGQTHRHPGQAYVRSARAAFSARRLYQAMAEQREPDSFWQGDFAVDDPYRTVQAEDVADISPEARDAYIGSIIVSDRIGLYNACYNYARQSQHTDTEKVQATYVDSMRALRILHLAQVILGGAVKPVKDEDLTEMTRAEAAARGEYW